MSGDSNFPELAPNLAQGHGMLRKKKLLQLKVENCETILWCVFKLWLLLCCCFRTDHSNAIPGAAWDAESLLSPSHSQLKQ